MFNVACAPGGANSNPSPPAAFLRWCSCCIATAAFLPQCSCCIPNRAGSHLFLGEGACMLVACIPLLPGHHLQEALW